VVPPLAQNRKTMVLKMSMFETHLLFCFLAVLFYYLFNTISIASFSVIIIFEKKQQDAIISA
jgi:hypothetical protein